MMVAGTVLRDLLPRRLRIPGDDTPWVEVRDRRRSVRSALAAGRLLTIAGVIVLIATVLMVLLDTGDTLAFAVVVGLTLLGLLGSAAWVLWYRYQESTGAIQRRQLQLLSSRLGSARPVERSRDRRQPADDATAPASGRRPDPDAEPRSARRASALPDPRGLDRPERTERESRRTPDSQVERAGAARRAERSPARREPHADHHPVAPRNDRPAPRLPGRAPLSRQAQPVAGPEREVQSPAAPHRPRGPEQRPSEARTRRSGTRLRP